MPDKRTDIATRQERGLNSLGASSPFSMLNRFADEVDRVFDDFGFGRGWMRPRFEANTWNVWNPQIDVIQRNNELVVRADLPGLKKDDVAVDVTDEGITISGERRQEQEEERGGVYRSERSYGRFQRFIPLPQGAMADQAKANFKSGVLEITMPAPPEQVTRGRRLEIADTSETGEKAGKTEKK